MHEGYYGKKKYLILYMKEYEYIDRREYYKNNREKILIYQKKYNKKNKEKIKQYQKIYYERKRNERKCYKSNDNFEISF